MMPGLPVTEELERSVSVALVAADAARAVTMKYFRQPLEIARKVDSSPVTIADKEAEAVIRQTLEAAFPEHGFYGEETGKAGIERDWVWVVDPIDGTTSFSTGKPTFGTLIALAYQGVPVLGVIDHPALDDRWVGVKDQPTTHNGKPVTTNQVENLVDAAAYTTTTKMFNEALMPRYQVLSKQCKFGVFGADCMAYGLLASGFAELVVEACLQPYDFMAVVPVVQGAGGVITDWQGEVVTLASGDQIVASASAELHRAALLALNEEA